MAARPNPGSPWNRALPDPELIGPCRQLELNHRRSPDALNQLYLLLTPLPSPSPSLLAARPGLAREHVAVAPPRGALRVWVGSPSAAGNLCTHPAPPKQAVAPRRQGALSAVIALSPFPNSGTKLLLPFLLPASAGEVGKPGYNVREDRGTLSISVLLGPRTVCRSRTNAPHA